MNLDVPTSFAVAVTEINLRHAANLRLQLPMPTPDFICIHYLYYPYYAERYVIG